MRGVLLAGSCLALCGCVASIRADEFKTFGDLGRAHEQAIVAVADEAIKANLDASSRELLDARDTAGPNSRTFDPEDRIDRANALSVNYVRPLMMLKRHAALLDRYFQDLSALAASNNEAAIATSAQGTVAALQKLWPEMAALKIGTESLPDAAKAVTPLIVRGIKVAALERELKRHGALIDRDLRAQEAALDLVARLVAGDQAILVERRLGEEVNTPYAEIDKKVGDDWTAKRREILLLVAEDQPKTVRAALESSRQLRAAFLKLADGQLQPADLSPVSEKVADLGGRLAQRPRTAEGDAR